MLNNYVPLFFSLFGFWSSEERPKSVHKVPTHLGLPLVGIFVGHGMITNQAHDCWGGSRGWFGWFV